MHFPFQISHQLCHTQFDQNILLFQFTRSNASAYSVLPSIAGGLGFSFNFQCEQIGAVIDTPPFSESIFFLSSCKSCLPLSTSTIYIPNADYQYNKFPYLMGCPPPPMKKSPKPKSRRPRIATCS